MAAWREQQSVESVPAFLRLWKSASALVSTMALATIVLGALTFVFPDPATALTEQVASADAAEAVIFDQGDEQLTYEQVLSTIDRKSTRLNSSHMSISYAVFCLK